MVTNSDSRVSRAFAMGFGFTAIELTYREIQEQFPVLTDDEAIYFANGSGDAVCGDTWRLRRGV